MCPKVTETRGCHCHNRVEYFSISHLDSLTQVSNSLFFFWHNFDSNFECMKLQVIKSVHFEKTVAQSSFLSKVLSFSLKSKLSQRKSQHFWKKWTDFSYLSNFKSLYVIFPNHLMICRWIPWLVRFQLVWN